MTLNTTMMNALNRIHSIMRDAAIKALNGDTAGALRRRDDVAGFRSAYDNARRELETLPASPQAVRSANASTPRLCRAPVHQPRLRADPGRQDRRRARRHRRTDERRPAQLAHRRFEDNLRRQETANRQVYEEAHAEYRSTQAWLLGIAALVLVLGIATAVAGHAQHRAVAARRSACSVPLPAGIFEARAGGRQRRTDGARDGAGTRRSTPSAAHSPTSMPPTAKPRPLLPRRPSRNAGWPRPKHEKREAERAQAEHERIEAARMQAEVAQIRVAVHEAAHGDLRQQLDIPADRPTGEVADALNRLFADLRLSITPIGENRTRWPRPARNSGGQQADEHRCRHQRRGCRPAALSAGQVSQRVENVAAATEEMSASIREISRATAEA